MNALTTLASEGIKHRDLWYPTILGVLVVISAVALFCGSIYMLLATNLGARLGFLVAAAGLSGLMVLLALLWLTNPSPVNTLKGRIPEWKAVESIESGDVARSKITAVQQINDEGRKVDEAEIANLKAAVDTNLMITKNEQTGEIESGAGGTYAVYEDATDYLVTDNQETGGGEIFSQFDVDGGGGFPWVHVSLHKPLYAVVTTCKVDPRSRRPRCPSVRSRPRRSARTTPVRCSCSSATSARCGCRRSWRCSPSGSCSSSACSACTGGSVTCRSRPSVSPAKPTPSPRPRPRTRPRRSEEHDDPGSPPPSDSWATAALLLVVAAGCSDGQLVDAGGEHGQGGLAFVFMTMFFFILFGSLFYMDRVRERRNPTDDE